MKIKIGLLILLGFFIYGCEKHRPATVICDDKVYEAKYVSTLATVSYTLILYNDSRVTVPKDICIVNWKY